MTRPIDFTHQRDIAEITRLLRDADPAFVAALRKRLEEQIADLAHRRVLDPEGQGRVVQLTGENEQPYP